MIEAHYKKLFQVITLGSSVVFILFLVAAGIREGFPEWRKYQKCYQKILIDSAKSNADREAAKKMRLEIKQIVLDEWKKIDRCQTCHLGVDDARMAAQELPYRAHSGEHLKHHPSADYGCTICHDGQG